MPSHTPSPHRFLAPATPSQKPPAKPPSGLRHAALTRTPKPTSFAPQQRPDEVGGQRRVTPAKRFVLPPPSARKTPNVGDGRSNAVGPSQATPRSKPKFTKIESIETKSPSSSASNGLDVTHTVEQSSVFAEDEGGTHEDGEDEILFVAEERSKRRRVSLDAPTSPSHPRAGSPQSHRRPSPQIPSPVSHRFKVPAPRATVFDNTSTPVPDRQTTSRPHFILPQQSSSPTRSTAVPLPETFSPSRKSGKYTPNGMAASLQSWIHEAASTGYTATTTSAVVWGRDKEDGVKMRVRISSAMGGRNGDEADVECWPGGVAFVRGTTDVSLYNASRASSLLPNPADENGHADVKIMLAGQGGARGKGGVRISTGGIVGVKAPIWDVCIGNDERSEKWLIGVEWVII